MNGYFVACAPLQRELLGREGSGAFLQSISQFALLLLKTRPGNYQTTLEKFSIAKSTFTHVHVTLSQEAIPPHRVGP